MHLYEQFPILKNHPLFVLASSEHVMHSFSEEDISLCDFLPGEVVHSSDTKDIRVGILLSGEANIYTPGGDTHALLKSAKAGEMFGIANLYATDSAFPTVIRAKSATKVLFFSGESFRRFIETDPQVLSFYLQFLSKKIVYLNRKIATFTAGSAEHRLAMFLLENHTNGIFEPPYSMSTLSQLLGVGRASLYRAIEKLSELSLIEHRNGSFYLLKEEALSEFSSRSSN